MNTQPKKDHERVFEEYLMKQGLKYTSQRKLIVRELFAAADHMEADEFIDKLHREGHRVSRGTVYSTLKLLVKARLVRKIKTPDNKVFYETIFGKEHHDHLICVDCGKIFEFNDPIIEERQEKIATEQKLKVSTHSHIIYASCQKENCKNKQETQPFHLP